jgi:CrcB protein
VSGAEAALLVCLAGGLGAGLRFVLDGLIRSKTSPSYPVATTVINLTGSLLLGLLTGMASTLMISQTVQLILGTGLLGGYTTFSTASYETVQLLENRRYLAAALYGFGTLIAAILTAALGYGLASTLT